jgi:hypothetical protein
VFADLDAGNRNKEGNSNAQRDDAVDGALRLRC